MEPNETDWRPMWELEEMEYLASQDEELEGMVEELRPIQETDDESG